MRSLTGRSCCSHFLLLYLTKQSPKVLQISQYFNMKIYQNISLHFNSQAYLEIFWKNYLTFTQLSFISCAKLQISWSLLTTQENASLLIVKLICYIILPLTSKALNMIWKRKRLLCTMRMVFESVVTCNM